MDIGIVVSAKTFLVLTGPLAQWFTNVARRVLAADHEADLAGRIGGNRSVSVFGNGEDLLASLLQVPDQREVQPLVLSWRGGKHESPAESPSKGGAGW